MIAPSSISHPHQIPPQRWIYFILLLDYRPGSVRKPAKHRASKGTFPIDPLFRAYYQGLGGEVVFGPAITPLFRKDDNFYLDTAGALFNYEVRRDGNHAFALVLWVGSGGCMSSPAGGYPKAWRAPRGRI